MCFNHDDGYVEMLAQKVKTARKPHRCSECGGAIEPGQRYRLTQYIFDDEFTIHHECRKCCWQRARIHAIETADGCIGSEIDPGYMGLAEAVEHYEGIGEPPADWQPGDNYWELEGGGT